MSSDLPTPRYSYWEAISAALAIGQRAIEEVRALARLPGAPGKDAVQPDSLTGIYDADTRTLNLTLFFNGNAIAECPIKLVGVPVDRGLWKKDAVYEKGDGVTWDGSWHIAQCDTTGEPFKTPDWRQAAKKGRDGKNAEYGKPSPAPIVKV